MKVAVRLAVRLYDGLLHLYPPAFRARFGDEMRATFRAALEAWPSSTGRLRFLVAAFADVLASAVGERLEASRTAARSRRPPQPHRGMDSLWQDLRFALRSLRRRPGFVAAVAITLALGIGGNTAVFSLVDAVLLHPLPVARPHELITIYHAFDDATPHEAVPYPLYRALDAQHRSLDALAAYHTLRISARVADRSEHLLVGAVSGDYFQVLGVRAQSGRLLAPDDDGAPGTNPVVVLSDQAWLRYFDRSPNAIGATIQAGDRAYTVIGVAPRGFRGTELTQAPALWFPLSMVTELGEGGLFSGRFAASVYTTHAFGWVSLVGRLRPGMAAAGAWQDLNATVVAYWREHQAEAAGREQLVNPVSVYPVVHAAALGDRDSLVRFLALLLAVVGITLLVACVNVANLMLVRSSERWRELAVRLALGARRTRVVRQLLVESVLLAILGGIASLLVGTATIRLLSIFTLPGEIALASLDLSLDGRVLAFTATVATIAALACGLAPALRASRIGPATALRAQRAGQQRTARGVLIAVQVALSLILLVGASLFVRSLQAGLRTDLGFDPQPLAAVTVNVQSLGYDRARELDYFRQAEARAREIPGVSAVAAASAVPLANLPRMPFSLATVTDAGTRAPQVRAATNAVTPGYFATLDLPLLDGRLFTEADVAGAPRVAMVSESAARLLSPDRSAIGRSIRLLGAIELTIVGVVKDTKVESVRDVGLPLVYLPLAQQSPTGDVSVVVRSSHPAAALTALQRSVSAIDPVVPVRDPRLVTDQLDRALMPQRFGATLLGLFAVIALVVAAVGIYGVVAYSVSQRSAELGIRIALGASRGDIARTVAWRTGVAVAIGGLAGVVLALVGMHGVERFLYGVPLLDPVAVVGASVLMAAAVVAAGLGPIRRALSVDPITAIRSD